MQLISIRLEVLKKPGTIDQWRYHYNNEWPHSSLNYLTPVAFADQAA